MVAENFERCLANILVDEGGNDDDPDDPGGRTSRGITQREFTAYLEMRGLPSRDVWNATDAEVRQIYHDSYWEPWCDKLPIGVDYAYFDPAVNEGPYRATVQLQRALGVRDDGHIGIVTMAAIAKADPAVLVNGLYQQRLVFYESLPKFWKYGRGWLRRLRRVTNISLKMISEATGG